MESALSEIVLRDFAAVKYTNVAFLMLLLYDHFITFDMEVAKIWTMPWRLPKFLFLINRYITPPMLFFNGLTPLVYNLSQNMCTFIARWTAWPTMLALGTIEILLVIRVLVIYGHGKVIARFLVCLYIGDIIVWLVLSCIISARTTGFPGGMFFSGCLFSAPSYFFAGWIPPVFFESVIIILTMYKILQYEKATPPLRVLARDSMIYFVFMFSFLVTNLFIARFGRGFIGDLLIGPSSIIACIAAARMSMNIREYTMAGRNDINYDLETMRFQEGSAAIVRADV